MKETGKLLKTQREKSGLSIEQVSEALKISGRVLRAMEDDQTSRLPQKVFLRGFVQSYAQYIGANVDEVLDCFQKETNPPAVTDVAAPVAPVENSQPPVQQPEVTPASPEPPKKTKPVPAKKSPATKKTRAVWAIDYRKWSLASKAFGFIVVAVLVGLIFFVTEMVKKYERESIVRVEEDIAAPPLAHDEEAILSSSPEDDALEIDEPTLSPEADTNVTTDAVSDAPTEPTEEVASPEVAVENTPEESPTPAAVATAEPEPTPEPEPEPTPEPVAQPEPEPTPEPKPAAQPEPAPASTAVSSGSQEVIIEAFDSVEITYSLDGEEPETVSLAPGDLHTLKADQKIKIEAANGGVINIFHNGRDLGVPGRLGQGLSRTYP